jgi:hypothetical protein
LTHSTSPTSGTALDETVLGPVRLLSASGAPQTASGGAAPSEVGVTSCTDRYPLIRLLGSGGMGDVHLTRHPVTGVELAVKRLKPHLLADRESVRRFVAEARHMFHMNHPRILRVLDVDDPPSGPFYTMPYLAAGSLGSLLKTGEPADQALTLRVARDVAEALAYAHGKGIIHRDLKPANVLMDADGHACLSDFGLVRDIRTNDSVQDNAETLYEGTAPYMSPAVARGEVEDTRCDIYSFGAVLYQMLTGAVPYPYQSVQNLPDTLRMIIDGPPTPIRQRNPKASKWLAAIAEGCMARELRDRYAGMADVVADLDRVAASVSPRGPHGTWRRRRGRRVLPALVFGVLFVVAMMVVVVKSVWLGHRQGASHVPTPTPAPATQPRTIDLMEQLRADPEALLAGATITDAGLEMDGGDDASVAVVLAADAPTGDYDLKLKVTRLGRRENGLDIALARRNPNAAFCWTVGGFNDLKAGFWRVDGVDLTDGNLTIQQSDQGWLGVGVKHEIEMRVRANSVMALLDGTIVCLHSTDYSDMRYALDGAGLRGHLGLRVYASHFLIHEAQVVEWPAAR